MCAVTVVCVPSEVAEAPPNGVQTVVWDGVGGPPASAAEVEFWVPSYLTSEPAARATGLAAMPGLRVIQVLSAGIEPWLPDVPDGVTLCSGRGVHGISTAELAIAGLLAVLRELPAFIEQQRAGEWRRHEGESLAGKRVLVIGAGDIGERTARAVQLFDADATLVARTARDGVHGIAELPDLLPGHDVVVLAVPHTPGTHGLVDAGFLAAMPDGAVLVNVARGQLVATDALLAELQAGRLRAFLDVTDPEPLPSEHPLWRAPNVLITPHVGGGAPGWAVRAAKLVRAQIERYLAGEPLANVVTDGY